MIYRNALSMGKIILVTFLLTLSLVNAQDWKTKFENATEQAVLEDKPILLVFSGSDWCGPCIKLDKNVWQSDLFKKKYSKSWVLLKADFPKKKANQLSPKVTENNNMLAEKYNKDGNFPLVVMLDKTGKVLGKMGFVNLEAEDYLMLLQNMVKK